MRELTTIAGRVYQIREDESDVRIDWTPSAPIAGFARFTRGEVNEDRKEGAIVTFSEKVKDGRKTKAISARVKGRPDLEELVRLAEVMESEIDGSFAAAALTLEPIGYHYVNGCDTGNTYDVLFPSGTNDDTEGLVERRLRTDWIEKHLSDADFRAIAKATGAEVEPAHMMSYGGYTFNTEGFRRLLSLAHERQLVIDAKADAKKAVREADWAAKMQAAKDTGKPVVLESWTEECDGSVDECSTDSVSRLGMPDGTITIRRYHAH